MREVNTGRDTFTLWIVHQSPDPVQFVVHIDRIVFSGKLQPITMETVFSVIAILVGIGLAYSIFRLIWDDEMPNWIG